MQTIGLTNHGLRNAQHKMKIVIILAGTVLVLQVRWPGSNGNMGPNSEMGSIRCRKNTFVLLALMAPYRAILRCYRCDTPYCAILFKGG